MSQLLQRPVVLRGAGPKSTDNNKRKQSKKATRAQYRPAKKAAVALKYPLCRTPEDRDRLARELGIESRQKIYNLASRLEATRPHANSQQELTSDVGYDPTKDTTRLFLRDDPDRPWSEDDDRYLREHFGRTFIEAIAVFLNRSETAVAYRARKLGLRNVPKYYDAGKVAPWLGLSLQDFFLLEKVGLEIFPCTDRHGRLRITLVSTTSLARVLLYKRLWKWLVDRRDADLIFILIFIRDVLESIAELQKGKAIWEPNPWVSHGHTCLNPFSEACFGWFYDGNDDKMAGADLDPRDLHPQANVTSDDWRRGEHGRDRSEEEVRELVPEFESHRRELEEEISISPS